MPGKKRLDRIQSRQAQEKGLAPAAAVMRCQRALEYLDRCFRPLCLLGLVKLFALPKLAGFLHLFHGTTTVSVGWKLSYTETGYVFDTFVSVTSAHAYKFPRILGSPTARNTSRVGMGI